MWLYAPRSQSMQSFLLTLGSTEGGKVNAIDDTRQHIKKPPPVPAIEHDGRAFPLTMTWYSAPEISGETFEACCPIRLSGTHTARSEVAPE